MLPAAFKFRCFSSIFINLSSDYRVCSIAARRTQLPVRRVITRCFVFYLALLLGACSSDYSNALAGTWKDVNNERYLTLEKNSEVAGGMNAIIYAPLNQPDDAHIETDNSEHNPVVMNHLSMPAVMHDGVLMLEVDAGYIPVLYDPVKQRVLLNGTDHYEKIPEEVAQLTLNPERVAHN